MSRTSEWLFYYPKVYPLNQFHSLHFETKHYRTWFKKLGFTKMVILSHHVVPNTRSSSDKKAHWHWKEFPRVFNIFASFLRSLRLYPLRSDRTNVLWAPLKRLVFRNLRRKRLCSGVWTPRSLTGVIGAPAHLWDPTSSSRQCSCEPIAFLSLCIQSFPRLLEPLKHIWQILALKALQPIGFGLQWTTS